MASWTEPKFYTEKAEQAAAVIQKTRQAALSIGVPHEKVARPRITSHTLAMITRTAALAISRISTSSLFVHLSG